MPKHQLVAKSTPTHQSISSIPRDQIGGSWGSLGPHQSKKIAQNTPISAIFYLALSSMTKFMLQHLKFSPPHKSHSMMPFKGYSRTIDGRALRLYVKVLAINPSRKFLQIEKQFLKRNCPLLAIKLCWLFLISKLFFFISSYVSTQCSFS